MTFEGALFEADATIGLRVSEGACAVGVFGDQDIIMYGAQTPLLKLGYHNNQGGRYAADECDYLDMTSWTGTLAPCSPSCDRGGENCGWAVGLEQRQLLWACVMAGTDYSKGATNIGLKKACESLSMSGTCTCSRHLFFCATSLRKASWGCLPH